MITRPADALIAYAWLVAIIVFPLQYTTFRHTRYSVRVVSAVTCQTLLVAATGWLFAQYSFSQYRHDFHAVTALGWLGWLTVIMVFLPVISPLVTWLQIRDARRFPYRVARTAHGRFLIEDYDRRSKEEWGTVA